jgi:uncharacterized protein YjiS (DUF1127 family)
MSIIILLFAARQAFSEWQHSQQAYGDLMALNGHLLADIGLDRWQISAMFGERIGRRRQCPLHQWARGNRTSGALGSRKSRRLESLFQPQNAPAREPTRSRHAIP